MVTIEYRILGVDHSTRTGWSLIVNGKCVQTGNFTLDEGMSNESFKDFDERLKFVIACTKPNAIAIEVPRHQTGTGITRFLTGLYTIEKLVALNCGLQIVEVDPRTMKKYIAGNGNATKKEVLDALIKSFSVPKELIHFPILYKTGKSKGRIKDYLYDESDATGLALYAYSTLNV